MMTERNGTYAPQRNWTAERNRLNDPARWELSTAERVVLDAIEVHIGQQAEGWPTQRRIGLQTGLSERQVRRVVESLVTRGYLAVRVVSELPNGAAGRGQRVMYRRGPRLEVGAHGGHDDWTRGPGRGHGDRSAVVSGGHDDRTRGRDDRTSRGGPGHDDRTSATFAGHGDRRFADMVSAKGSEIKEISERARARESRGRTERERENAAGATRVSDTGLAGLAVIDFGCLEKVIRQLSPDGFGRSIERAWLDAGDDALRQPAEEPTLSSQPRSENLEKAFQRLLQGDDARR